MVFARARVNYKAHTIYNLYLPIFLQMIQIRSLLISVSEDLEPLCNLCNKKSETQIG